MKFSIVLFTMIASIFAEKKLDEIYVFSSPELVKNQNLKENSIHGFVDLEFDYDQLHSLYTKNTKEIESSHFSKKITIDTQAHQLQYHLVYTHWLVGELFKLEEKHQKTNKEWWPCSSAVVFPKKNKADMWIVEKYLLPKTKNSWVGDNLNHLRMVFAFIDMGENKTRLFFHMVVDAEGCRTTHECKKQMCKILRKIVSLVNENKKCQRLKK